MSVPQESNMKSNSRSPSQKAVSVSLPVTEEAEKVEKTPSAASQPLSSPASTDAMPPPSSQVSEKRVGEEGEMDLVRMVLESSSLMRATSVNRSSVRYNGRASVSNAHLVSAQEYDELRARYNDAKQELLKLGTVQSQLDFARFDANRFKEDARALEERNAFLRRQVEQLDQRCAKEQQARAALERKRTSDSANLEKEVAYLKQLTQDLREENARRVEAAVEQQKSATLAQVQALHEELAGKAQEADDLAARLTQALRLREAQEAKLTAATSEAEKARADVDEYRIKAEELQRRCLQAEEQHRQYVNQQSERWAKQSEEQKAAYERHAQEVLRSKEEAVAELQAEVQSWKAKAKATAEELAAAKHTLVEVQEEVRQLGADQQRELRRLAEEHRIALLEKQAALEQAVREARGSAASREEEVHALHRQLTQASSELSTVAGVLAQREKQLAKVEEELTIVKDRRLALEQENAQLASDAQLNAEDAADAGARVSQLTEELKAQEERAADYVASTRARISELETALRESRLEVSALKRDMEQRGDSADAAARELRAQVAELTTERDALQGEVAAQQVAAEAAGEYRKRYEAERAKADALSVDLGAAVNRCTTLERQLEERSQQLISHAMTPSPMQEMLTNCATREPSAKQLSVSPATRSMGSVSGGSTKRARTEDARVFAISGFDGHDVLMALQELPAVGVAQSKSNMPVPSNLTHLISNGQLTVKLLTALVRGCWVLPERYVIDSLKEQRWLREEDYGFHHEALPLLKKRIAFTAAFTSSKHFQTASLIVREGGAVVVGEGAAEADMVLSTVSEARRNEGWWSWDRLVDMIYPIKIE